MKNLVWAFWGLFLSLSVQAQEVSTNSITCPPERFPSFALEEFCQGNKIVDGKMQISRIQEVVVPKIFEQELNAYHRELNVIYRDNSVNANIIAERGIFFLRRHNECLREICYAAFLECTRDLSIDTIYQQGYQWCDTKRVELDLINRTKLYSITTRNQARKETSLQTQKWQAIDIRMKQYFHYWLGKFVQNFQKFVDKVFNFIATPAT